MLQNTFLFLNTFFSDPPVTDINDAVCKLVAQANDIEKTLLSHAFFILKESVI